MEALADLTDAAQVLLQQVAEDGEEYFVRELVLEIVRGGCTTSGHGCTRQHYITTSTCHIHMLNLLFMNTAFIHLSSAQNLKQSLDTIFYNSGKFCIKLVSRHLRYTVVAK